MKKLVYSITKERCKEMINGLFCPCCGKKVVPIRTVDNARNPTFWGGCKKCNRFTWGVYAEVFLTAKDMVDNHNYIAYSYMGVKSNYPESEWPEWERSQYAGTCNTVMQVLQSYKKFTK